jgi:cation:H+ antiporter
MDSLILIFFVMGLILLIAGAEVLVRGAAKFAAAVGISPLVIGLTVVAFCTSSPELAVTIQSSFAGQADLALGNIVGSNISNILLILGLSALIVPLTVQQQLIWLDVPVVVGVSVLVLLMGLDGKIDRLDGAILFTGIIGYTIWSIRQSRKEKPDVKAEYAQEYDRADPSSLQQYLIQLAQIMIGLAMLIIGSNWLVEGAVAFAKMLGVSELIIGLTVIAVGTSLPELAASVVASRRGERDIAVGNVVGSNIFNILSVLGLASLVSPNGINVPPEALRFDIPVMIAAAVACLPIFFNQHQILRWEGGLLFGYYLAYTTYLLLNATQHDALPAFSGVMAFFVLPLTGVTLLIILVQAWRNQRRQAMVE